MTVTNKSVNNYNLPKILSFFSQSKHSFWRNSSSMMTNFFSVLPSCATFEKNPSSTHGSKEASSYLHEILIHPHQ